MKFPVAVTVIASSTLAEASSKQWHANKEARPNTIGYFQSLRRRQKHVEGQLKRRSSHLLRNYNLRECFPISTRKLSIGKEYQYYDVGILGCEPHQYCVESDSSDLGGVCVGDSEHQLLLQLPHQQEQRVLQNYYAQSFSGISNCDPNAERSYECDCTQFDLDSNTGSFTCVIYQDYCFEESICGDFKVKNALTSEGTTTDYCYSFQDPFGVEVCYRFHNDNSCDVLVDNEACNSCEIVDVENQELGYTSFNCLSFNCTNTFTQQTGNDCLGSYLLDGIFPLGTDSTAPPFPVPEEGIATDAPENSDPSESPSQQPSDSPTFSTQEPTISPKTKSPTSKGAFSTTDSPTIPTTEAPTDSQTEIPTVSQTEFPTVSPTHSPSAKPSSRPSAALSTGPSIGPSLVPTGSPSVRPSALPSDPPTGTPSTQPTAIPTESPTLIPSFINPSSIPTRERSDTTWTPSSVLMDPSPPALIDPTPPDPSVRFSSTAPSIFAANGFGIVLLVSLAFSLWT